ncbi:MAG: PHP domain-containing protein [Lachnospiraceae bacterium]|nr:PHP domain-containing protein [Lachnospiraceae bacterium]
MIDLHVHSTVSDGTLTPSELVIYAKNKNLTAFALTDHDTIDGIAEAMEAGINHNITVIPGIEISSFHFGREIHILGLNLGYKDGKLISALSEYKRIRKERNDKLIVLLNQNGFPVTNEEMIKRFPNSIITRAHYAAWMVENGYVKSKDAAFRKYLGDGCPCYLPKEHVSPEYAINLIKNSGGKAILAHPLLYKFSNSQLDTLVSDLAKIGLDGIEAIYSCNKGSDTSKMKCLAKKYGLFITGGSDFHGENKPGIDIGSGYGGLNVPDEVLSDILQ